ncbi:MAG: hypothetical protein KA210_06610 [Bacteroidia bacterium]|nr:hypothetical protein [Bacteroidia bacterium]
MKKQTIKLDCGHEVEVIAIDIRRTYGEFLAGQPTFEDNIYVVENLKAPKHWGNRKTVKYMDSFDLNLKTFKPYTVFLWLSSDKSVNDPQNKFDGSEVVAVWTIDDLFTFSVNSLIEEGIQSFDWESVAFNTNI